MTAYKEFDDAIIAHIVQRPWQHPIYSEYLLQAAARELGRGIAHGDGKEWRLIDSRLQSLRKAGQIEFVRGVKKKWQVVKPNEKPVFGHGNT